MIPRASDCDLLPTPTACGQVIEVLAAQGWTDRAASCVIRDLDTYSKLAAAEYRRIGEMC